VKMTEFQEGRTYLWIYSRPIDFDAGIITGEPDGDLLYGDDGEWYESFVGPLNWAAYHRARALIERRDELLDTAKQNTIVAGGVARTLIELWRSVA